MKIYFLGIGGTAMGHAALLVRQLGHEIIGADERVYPPMSDILRENGIAYREGFSKEALAGEAPDLVVIGNAYSRGHPEIEWLWDTRAIPVTSLPALLHDFVLDRRDSIVVAGTHGKTTTTALLAHLFRTHGVGAGFLLGGAPLNFRCGADLGEKDTPFLIEGDEYDSAFFDKRAKFIHYRPRLALLNNLEFDHGDIYRDLEDVRRSFRHFVRLVPGNGWLILNADDPSLAEFVSFPHTRVWTVGTGPNCATSLTNFHETSKGSSFELHWKGRPWGKVEWPLGGAFNARNAAMAVTAFALWKHPPAGDPPQLNWAAFGTFQGVRKRQEVLTDRDGVRLLLDFAHHPTAIRETLASLRARFPHQELWVAIEPRSNTLRGPQHTEALRTILPLADRVWFAPLHRAALLAEEERLPLTSLTNGLMESGTPAMASTSFEEMETDLWAALARRSQPVLLVFFSNGAFGGLPGRLASRLAGERDA